MTTPLDERISSLTQGEREVLDLAAQHLRSAEIAHRLSLSPKTVDNRISRAMRKLGVSDRDSAIRLLLRKPPGENPPEGFPSLVPAGSGAPPPVTPRLPLPWPTERKPENDYSTATKFVLVLVLAAGMMAVTSIYIIAVLLIDRLT